MIKTIYAWGKKSDRSFHTIKILELEPITYNTQNTLGAVYTVAKGVDSGSHT